MIVYEFLNLFEVYIMRFNNSGIGFDVSLYFYNQFLNVTDKNY